MQHRNQTPPQILCLSGHDPSGGAGLQADIESVNALGGHALTVPTCLTTQNTLGVDQLHPLRGTQIQTMLQCLLKDIRPHAIKIGLLTDPQQVKTTGLALNDSRLRNLPLVIDPVMRAGSGDALVTQDLLESHACALRQQLIPKCTLLTPNQAELAALVPEANDPDEQASRLLHEGCRAVLVTGTDDTDPDNAVTNVLYQASHRTSYDWPRLPARYHGSGCTLASACAVLLAADAMCIKDAARRAQQYTWKWLAAGYQPGRGQHLPYRYRP